MIDRVTGKVIRLHVNQSDTAIRLDNSPATGPKDNYFRLPFDHPSYNSLYSLVLAAAANRWSLQIKIRGENQVSTKEVGVIENIVVDWAG